MFGKPTFSLPDNDISTKGGKLVARVSCPFAGLLIDSAIWSKERVDTEKGETETIYTVRLPYRFSSGIRAVEGDVEAAAAIRMWQEDLLTVHFDQWLTEVEKAGTAARKAQAPRLVRKTKRSQPGPTANQAAVNLAAGVAGA